MRPRTRLGLAVLLAGAIALGAAGTVAAYWLTHQAQVERVEAQRYEVELAPTRPGAYEVLLPLPADAGGRAARLQLRVVEGEARATLEATEHGPALRVRAAGPAKLAAEGALPLRLSLDDPAATFKQFRFLAFLGPDAAGPVLVKVAVEERARHADWERRAALAHAVVVQQALEPAGWQQVKAVHYFDVAAGGGYAADLPRLAVGAGAVALAAAYLPLGLVLLEARRGAPATAPRAGLRGNP